MYGSDGQARAHVRFWKRRVTRGEPCGFAGSPPSARLTANGWTAEAGRVPIFQKPPAGDFPESSCPDAD